MQQRPRRSVAAWADTWRIEMKCAFPVYDGYALLFFFFFVFLFLLIFFCEINSRLTVRGAWKFEQLWVLDTVTSSSHFVPLEFIARSCALIITQWWMSEMTSRWVGALTQMKSGTTCGLDDFRHRVGNWWTGRTARWGRYRMTCWKTTWN